MSDPITTIYRPLEEDFFRAGKSVSNQSFFYRNDPFLMGLFIFAVCMIVIMAMSDEISVRQAVAALPFSLTFAVPAGVLVYIWHKFAPWIVRRRLKKSFDNSPAMREEKIIRFSDEGVHLSSESTSSNINWSAFSRVKEYETEFMFFFGNEPHGWFIPKSAIPYDDDINRLRYIIKTNVGSRADVAETSIHPESH